MNSEIAESCRRLERALESVDDVIVLLDWRYQEEALSSIAKLECLRTELKLGLALAGADAPLH